MWCLESVARFEGIQAVWKYGYATVWYNPLLLCGEGFTRVCSTRNAFTHLGRNWPCLNTSHSGLPPLNCLLFEFVLLGPEFSL